jgi:hypothetical protein
MMDYETLIACLLLVIFIAALLNFSDRRPIQIYIHTCTSLPMHDQLLFDSDDEDYEDEDDEDDEEDDEEDEEDEKEEEEKSTPEKGEELKKEVAEAKKD